MKVLRVDFGEVESAELAGDGPILGLVANFNGLDDVRFAGRLNHDKISCLYVAGGNATGDRERVLNTTAEDVCNLHSQWCVHCGFLLVSCSRGF